MGWIFWRAKTGLMLLGGILFAMGLVSIPLPGIFLIPTGAIVFYIGFRMD